MSRVLLLMLVVAWTSAPALGAVFTMSCDGALSSGPKQEAVSNMGLVLNLDTRTVSGFSGIVAPVDRINENMIVFKGNTADGWYIEGLIDRITGSLRADKTLAETSANNSPPLRVSYNLTCRLVKAP